jgi:lipid II:glycine glycyltransferase (peptidoglycan interpeptide bridge formation enzyme)
VERVAVCEGSQIIAGAQVLFRSLPVIPLTLAYVPMGPLVDWGDEAVVRALLVALRAAARRRRAFCLTLEPGKEAEPSLADLIARQGLRPGPESLQPETTILVALGDSEEAILARMTGGCRRNIRRALTRGQVQVRVGTEADVPAFEALMDETARRDGFAAHSASYYRAFYDVFAATGQMRFLLAFHEGELLAGLMVFAAGRRAWSMYAASAAAHREMMPNYLLQWQAMMWAKERGCQSYDLWGVPNETEAVLEANFEQRSDGLWGVYRFKRGFGGRVVQLLGTYDDVRWPLTYRLYTRIGSLLGRLFGETWHRRLRRG